MVGGIGPRIKHSEHRIQGLGRYMYTYSGISDVRQSGDFSIDLGTIFGVAKHNDLLALLLQTYLLYLTFM
jgi:hypothetical protein